VSVDAPDPRPRVRTQQPSWIGTLVVAIAVIVLCVRAAAQLRHSVAPAASGAPAPSAAP